MVQCHGQMLVHALDVARVVAREEEHGYNKVATVFQFNIILPHQKKSGYISLLITKEDVKGIPTLRK